MTLWQSENIGTKKIFVSFSGLDKEIDLTVRYWLRIVSVDSYVDYFPDTAVLVLFRSCGSEPSTQVPFETG